MENNTANTQKSKGNTALKVILKVILTAFAGGAIFLVGTLVGLLLAADLNIHLVLNNIATILVPELLLLVIWVKQKKKFMKLWLAVAAVCAVAVGVNYGLSEYDSSLQIDTSSYSFIYENQPDYYPFEEDSRIVKLDSETLELAEPLPVIDGAQALLPVYSGFVHAVYPNTEALYEEGIYDCTTQGAFEFLSEWGYKELAGGESDIFFDLYPTRAGEEYAQSSGATLEYTTVGTEAMVFIVDKDNPIDNLTSEQIRGIYSGEITNWKEVGGKSKKIKPYQSEEGSVSQELMKIFMGDTVLMQAPSEMGYGDLFGWEELRSRYRNKAGSIGYTFHYAVADNPDIKLLSVDGVAPTRENIENGSYRVVTPVYAVTRQGNTNENLGKLLDWVLSEEGKYIIEESGYFAAVSDYLS